MTGEFIGIIASVAAVGIGLAVLIVHSTARLERRIDRVEDSLGRRIDGVEKGQVELRERMAKLEAELRERMAKLEGLLEGLREAISGRRAA